MDAVMSTEIDLEALLEFGNESRGIEVKGPGIWSKREDPNLFGKVVRAILGMANRQDGGSVIVGIDQADDSLEVTGLTSDEAATWRRDAIGDAVAEYADPFVTFEVETLMFRGKILVAIRVAEFEDYPVVCKKTFQVPKERPIVRDGACYVRGRRKPETIEISTHNDMRELLDLATQKRLRRLISQLQGANINFEEIVQDKNLALFEQQIKDFLG